MTKPFLDCLPIEKLANAIEILEDWQEKYYCQSLGLLSQLEDKEELVHIDAPDYEEMEEIEVDHEIRERPHHQERVE